VIRANAARYPIPAQCRILGVPRSTYYWMIEHPETERVDPIAGDVRAVWRDSRERYGARKIKAALERRGVTASRRRIGNIMREQGMTSAYARGRFKPLCSCKLASTVWSLFFSSIGGWFPAETAPSEPAALFLPAIWS